MSEREHLSDKRPFLEARSLILQAVRSFFLAQGFLEVQTPVVTLAPAPETHIEAVPLKDSGFLVTSPELFMKRLLSAGYGRIFQITPVFRRGERGRYHHPEFTLLEWYRLNADYHALQEDCLRLLRSIWKVAAASPALGHRAPSLRVDEPWERVTVAEAFNRFAGWKPGPDVDQDRFDTDLVERVEPNLGFPRPCILTEYPANQAALARLKPGDPSVAERFELYWGGIELANGFSELTDPREQRSRFEHANALRLKLGLSPYPSPEAFLNCLEHLPPCAGMAMGVDRLVMLLTGADGLDQVVAFPPGWE
jgi:lysyl-tRNA synthetase class 2